jgi:hypothetical protein
MEDSGQETHSVREQGRPTELYFCKQDWNFLHITGDESNSSASRAAARMTGFDSRQRNGFFCLSQRADRLGPAQPPVGAKQTEREPGHSIQPSAFLSLPHTPSWCGA